MSRGPDHRGPDTSGSPDPLPLRLLRRWLPGDRAEELAGDLHEDFRRRRARQGPVRARLWAWRQAVAWWAARWRALRPGPRSLRTIGRAGVDEFRHALRLVVQRPGLSAVVVLTLGLCIGAGTAVFSVVRGAVLDPWPYEAPFRIMVVRGESPALDRELAAWSVPEALELARQPVFEAAVTGDRWDVTLTEGEGPPARFRGVRFNAGAWSMLGVEPLLGRVFTAAEDRPGGDRVVVIGHALWQERFGADPAVVGRELTVEGEPYTVVGVMPPRFWFWGAQLWAPLRLDPAEAGVADRSDRWLTVQARLREDLGEREAEARLRSLARRLEREHGGRVVEYRDLRFDLTSLHDEVLGDVEQALLVLAGGVLLVLLVACANVANLLLARTMARRRDLGVRAALGAGRGRTVWQLVVEGLVLALPSGALGIVLAWLGLPRLMDLIPDTPIPSETVVQIEGWTLAVAVVLAVAAGLSLAAPAAWSALRLDPGKVLASGGRAGSDASGLRRARSALLLSQVAVSMLVVCGAAWLASGYARLATVDPGFDLEQRVTMRVELSRHGYDRPERIVGFYRELTRALEARPEIRTAAVVQFLPLTGAPPVRFAPVGGAGEDATLPVADLNHVGPGYFEAVGIPLLAGRFLGAGDDATSGPVAVVSRSLAERQWPGREAVGQRLRVHAPVRASAAAAGSPPSPTGSVGTARTLQPPVELTVVGVAGDVRQESMRQPVRPQIYLPHAQSLSGRTGLPMRFMSLVARSDRPLAEVATAAREELAGLDPALPLMDVRSYDEVALESLGGTRFTAVLLGLFALLAAILAGVGVFALTAHAVSSRTREIGIRRALGARDASLRWLLLRRGLAITVAGVAAGGAAALASRQLLESLVHGLEGAAVPTVAAVAAGFLVLVAVAAWLPARRIARIDPSIALRRE